MTLQDGTLLYHGSYTAIDKIDLSRCATGKDFGKGFYLTADKEQAKRFILFEFDDATKEWLWFISLNRRARLAKDLVPLIDKRLLDSDVIIGKIANDTTNPVITTYLNGLYGPIDREASATTAINMLLPNRLKLQYCFLTEKAIACLKLAEVVRYDA